MSQTQNGSWWMWGASQKTMWAVPKGDRPVESEGGRYWQMEEYWVPCWVGCFRMHFLHRILQCMASWSPPAMWGRESGECWELDHCQGSGWPRRRAQAPALRHSLPPLPLHSEGTAAQEAYGAPLWGRDGGGFRRVHRKQQASTQDPRRHKGKITDPTTRWSRVNRRETQNFLKSLNIF